MTIVGSRQFRVTFATINAASVAVNAWEHSVGWMVFSGALYALYAGLLFVERS